MSKEWFIKAGGQVCFKSENCELNGWDTQSLVDCLNGKEIKIADLKHQLALTEKALELACEEHYWYAIEYYVGDKKRPTQKEFVNNHVKLFKKQAKEMMKSE